MMSTNKFIKFQIIAQLEEPEEEDTQVVGFAEGSAPKKSKKRSKKKPEMVVTTAIIPIDTITSIIKGDGGLTIVDTLDKTFQVTDDFDTLLKRLKVR